MTESPQTPGTPVKTDPPAGPQPPDGGAVISKGRKVRLVMLLAVLLALGVTALVMKLQAVAAERQRQHDVAQALSDMRQALGEPNLPKAEARWKRIVELDPSNADADALLVPYCLAAGQMDDVVTQFNHVAGAGAVQPAAAAAAGTADPVMQAVLARPGASAMTLKKPDMQFITDEGSLSALAHRVVRGAASDRDRALLLCEWFALHVEPADPCQMPADPRMVVWRSFGSPEQAAWAYAELTRLAGIPCAVVVAPGGATVRLVQVYPAGGTPFLVDPGRGVPVLDPTSHELLSLSSPGLAAGYSALLALASEKPDYSAEDLKAATLQRAVYPNSLMPRYAALDRLCACLPEPPHMSFSPAPLPGGQEAALWALPLQTVQTYDDAARAAKFADAHRWLSMAGKLGNLLLLQPDPQADAVLAGVKQQLAQSQAPANAPGGAAVLRDAIEVVSFWQAVNAHDSGEHALAVKLLKEYQASYAEGRWKSAVSALLADSLAQSGQADAAKEAWKTMPPGRRLYGAMRATGLLPLAKAAVPAAVAAPAVAPTKPT